MAGFFLLFDAGLSQECLEWSLAGHFSRTRIQLVLDEFGWAQGCLVAQEPEVPVGAVTVKSAASLEGSGVVRELGRIDGPFWAVMGRRCSICD